MAEPFFRLEIVFHGRAGSTKSRKKLDAAPAARSAAARLAYRGGWRLTAPDGTTPDYTKRSGVAAVDVILDDGAPDWLRDAQQVADHLERDGRQQANSQYFEEHILSIDRRLPTERHLVLVREYIERAGLRGRGVVYAFLHVQEATDGDDNVHAHLMIPVRRLLPDGSAFGKTVRQGQDRKSVIARRRECWAAIENAELQRLGFEPDIDHRSRAAKLASELEQEKARLLTADQDLSTARWAQQAAADERDRERRMRKLVMRQHSKVVKRVAALEEDLDVESDLSGFETERADAAEGKLKQAQEAIAHLEERLKRVKAEASEASARTAVAEIGAQDAEQRAAAAEQRRRRAEEQLDAAATSIRSREERIAALEHDREILIRQRAEAEDTRKAEHRQFEARESTAEQRGRAAGFAASLAIIDSVAEQLRLGREAAPASSTARSMIGESVESEAEPIFRSIVGLIAVARRSSERRAAALDALLVRTQNRFERVIGTAHVVVERVSRVSRSLGQWIEKVLDHAIHGADMNAQAATSPPEMPDVTIIASDVMEATRRDGHHLPASAEHRQPGGLSQARSRPTSASFSGRLDPGHVPLALTSTPERTPTPDGSREIRDSAGTESNAASADARRRALDILLQKPGARRK